MKTFLLKEPHFIGGTLLAAGSRVTEAELAGSKPGQGLVEIGANGQPKHKEDAEDLRHLGISAAPIEVAPVSPHAPNPTAPQALPAHNVGEVLPAGEYVAAEGVESNEAAAARAEQQEATSPQRRKK
ncbi:hypothetical protein [Sphingomonas sp.]|uniref:hypothetical protein n=1 Tax=Sphingomonas sp. TaxID=28214 RepID=UPI0025F20C23|nr:hypothetical protein [Sphingomonas sp.]MBV9528170.1 hypothetical protein [Sphingomonas sp.]